MIFEGIHEKIKSYCTALELHRPESDADSERIAACLPMLRKIAESPQSYDKSARLNLDWIGQELKDIVEYKKLDQADIHSLSRYLARVAREATLRSPYIAKSPEKELLELFEYSDSYESLEDKETSDFIWASLPKYVASDYLKDIGSKEDQMINTFNEWDKKVLVYKTQIDSYVSILKEQQGKFNFVYLSKAFHEMHSEKKGELGKSFRSLLLLGFFVLLPLVYQFFARGVDVVGDSVLAVNDIWRIISLVGVEVALLYFFRIALKNYYSTKAQLLQLELRLSLCAFIESYVDFAKSRKTKDADPLAKFESIIFSGITPDETSVPSTFDGMDQILKMAKEFKR